MIAFAGVKFKNPFIVASGPVTSTIERLKRIDAQGAGGASTKLTLMELPYRSTMRMYSDPDRFGIVFADKRLELDEGLKLVAEAKRQTSLVIFANITHVGEDLAGWATLGKRFEEAGADIIEANLNCPNISLAGKMIGERAPLNLGGVVGQDPVTCEQIIRTLKSTVRIPVVGKITCRVAHIAELAQACKKGGADGVVSASGYPGLPRMDIMNHGRPLHPCWNGVTIGSVIGGPATLSQAFANVATVAKNVQIPVIGGNGVHDWRDAIEMMMWGAGMVTACTAVMWKGYGVIGSIIRGMEDFIVKAGYGSYEELVGASLPYLMAGSDITVKPGTAVIDQELCIACGQCSDLGHCDAVVQSEGIYYVDGEACIGCGICLDVCPSGAITLEATV
jgi:dihydroorotate dehydrogenase/Pyruvate/2-oxoacid:ferredoxin oxidoreductase delta subunit